VRPQRSLGSLAFWHRCAGSTLGLGWVEPYGADLGVVADDRSYVDLGLFVLFDVAQPPAPFFHFFKRGTMTRHERTQPPDSRAVATD
jgi:hypothetical protein